MIVTSFGFSWHWSIILWKNTLCFPIIHFVSKLWMTSCTGKKSLLGIFSLLLLKKNALKTERKSACYNVTIMWYLRTPSFWLEAANRGWRILFFWRVESFTERWVVWGSSHKVLNELLHRQRLLLQWRCCFIPCTLQFNPVCSSKKKNVLIVLEVRSPSLCFTAWSAGTGGDTNAALPGMSRSHIQLALVHC